MTQLYFLTNNNLYVKNNKVTTSVRLSNVKLGTNYYTYAWFIKLCLNHIHF